VLELVRHSKLKLSSHPVLVSREERKSSSDVVKDGVLSGLTEVIDVEQSTEVIMWAE
jgi:hypothetical protein